MKATRIAALLAVSAALAAILWQLQTPPNTAPGSPPHNLGDVPPTIMDEPDGSGATAQTEADSNPRVTAAERKLPTAASIRGRVLDTSDAPLADIVVVAENLTANGLRLAASTASSDRNGEFRFDDLLAGREYHLLVEPQRDHAPTGLGSFVAGRNERLPDIRMQAIQLVDIDGLLVDADGLPVADFEFAVQSIAIDLPARTLRSDSSGFFSLRDFPAGEIDITTSGADFYHLQGVTLRADEYRTLTLVIDQGSHYLGGWIGDANGVPVPGAQITLKSALDVDGYTSFSYRATVADENGGFAFSRLGGARVSLNVLARDFEIYTQKFEFTSFSETIVISLQRQTP